MKDLIKYLSETFPKEWKKFINYAKSKGYIYTSNKQIVSLVSPAHVLLHEATIYEILGLLIEWLDSKGGYIEIMYDLYYAKTSLCEKYHVAVNEQSCADWGEAFYQTRNEATIAGIKKAFEFINKTGSEK